MPNLPTLAVTDPQATRITAAFGSVANYKTELRKWIKDRVLQHEAQVLMDKLDADVQTKIQNIEQDLGNIS